jgi:RND family efflux transporter MFP subunit
MHRAIVALLALTKTKAFFILLTSQSVFYKNRIIHMERDVGRPALCWRASAWIGVVAAALAACSPAPAPLEPVRAVKLLTVGLSTLGGESEFAGEVRARTESRLGFRVGGKLLTRSVEVGQHVVPGQLLAQLDPQDYQLAASAATAQVAAALTNRDLAGADFKRYKELQEQGFISGAELERRDTALKAAQAQLDQAQAQGAAQGHQAGYASLRADVAGLVTAVEAEPGQVVAAGTPVLRVALDGPRDVVFSVPEDRVGAITLGSKVQVRAWAQAATRAAVVREVGALADAVTRTYSVKVALAEQDALPLGSTAQVLLPAGRAGTQAITLPTSALRQDGKGTAVWVLDPASMQVRLQPITLTSVDGNDAVVASGLTAGMQVVSTGVHVLSPGQKVSVFAPQPAASGAVVPVKGN